MDKNLQIAITMIIVAGAIYMCYTYHKQSMENANRPVYITQNFVSFNHSPTTTNIESIEGNGHTIGNKNKVENEVA